jgi:hypothetical protein
MLVRLETSEPIAFFIYLLLLFITLTVSLYHSDEDEAPSEDDPAVEDFQSVFDDSDNEASAGNKEDEEPSLFGDLLTMSWRVRKVRLDHDYSIIGWALSVMPEVYKDA